ncbi:DUF4383 domain-containing protein, partial [Streptomyces rhizosphaericola]
DGPPRLTGGAGARPATRSTGHRLPGAGA